MSKIAPTSELWACDVVAISPFSLASDTDLAVARALGVADENSRRAALVPDAAGSATKDALKKLRAFDYAKSHGSESFG